jgi:hypothetical protein
MACNRRQNASSRETLVRCPAISSERLTTRVFALSVTIGLCETAGVELGFGARSLALDETLLGLRAAKDRAILSGVGLLPLALFQLSRLAQINNISQRTRLGYFFRNASIDTTFVSPACSVGFSAA